MKYNDDVRWRVLASVPRADPLGVLGVARAQGAFLPAAHVGPRALAAVGSGVGRRPQLPGQRTEARVREKGRRW